MLRIRSGGYFLSQYKITWSSNSCDPLLHEWVLGILKFCSWINYLSKPITVHRLGSFTKAGTYVFFLPLWVHNIVNLCSFCSCVGPPDCADTAWLLQFSTWVHHIVYFRRAVHQFLPIFLYRWYRYVIVWTFALSIHLWFKHIVKLCCDSNTL